MQITLDKMNRSPKLGIPDAKMIIRMGGIALRSLSSTKPKVENMLYRERMRQANREAKVTVAGVAVVIICWLIFGFGLYGIDITIFSTPLWIVMGCLGTWLVAMVVSIILATKVIEDCPLDEDDFGRKYQMKDATPVEVSPMIIDHDIMKKAEKTAVHPRKPVSNTTHRASQSSDKKKA